MSSKAKVFLDTNVLLKAFLSYRRFKNGEIEYTQMQQFMIDDETKKFTFEKCIYEAFLTFRGIGGKKPDEGRGNYADNYLKSLNDPKSISKLISQIHNDNKSETYYWLNEIESLRYDYDFKEDSNKEEYLKDKNKKKELLKQKDLFLSLCREFENMIDFFKVRKIYYIDIFGNDKESDLLISFNQPSNLRSFVLDTAIPSEDFEIIYAAERIGADIFVTDDKKLITCSKSLGQNYFLSPAAFCESDKYEEKKKQFKENCMFAEFDKNNRG